MCAFLMHAVPDQTVRAGHSRPTRRARGKCAGQASAAGTGDVERVRQLRCVVALEAVEAVLLMVAVAALNNRNASTGTITRSQSKSVLCQQRRVLAARDGHDWTGYSGFSIVGSHSGG